MKLIIGLGNPESQYKDTRHNVGFRVLETYAENSQASFSANKKLKSEVTTVGTGDNKILLVKPTTYYNLIGEAARAVVDFYKLELEDILIVHDDLALPFGTIRTRIGGSDGGNNGIKSINQHLGPDTARVRIGVANQLRERMDDATFVLSKFSQHEAKELQQLTKKAIEQIDDFTNDSFTVSTHR